MIVSGVSSAIVQLLHQVLAQFGRAILRDVAAQPDELAFVPVEHRSWVGVKSSRSSCVRAEPRVRRRHVPAVEARQQGSDDSARLGGVEERREHAGFAELRPVEWQAPQRCRVEQIVDRAASGAPPQAAQRSPARGADSMRHCAARCRGSASSGTGPERGSRDASRVRSGRTPPAASARCAGCSPRRAPSSWRARTRVSTCPAWPPVDLWSQAARRPANSPSTSRLPVLLADDGDAANVRTDLLRLPQVEARPAALDAPRISSIWRRNSSVRGPSRAEPAGDLLVVRFDRQLSSGMRMTVSSGSRSIGGTATGHTKLSMAKSSAPEWTSGRSVNA